MILLSSSELVSQEIEDKLLFLNGHTKKINDSLKNIQKDFLRVGFLVYEVNAYKWFYPKYETIVDYCFDNFGFKKTQTYNFISVIDKFALRNDSGTVMFLKLKDGFEDYNFTQLCELLSVDPQFYDKFSPDLSARKIRERKKDFHYSLKDISDSSKKIDSFISKVQSTGKVEQSVKENVVVQSAGKVEQPVKENVAVRSIDDTIDFLRDKNYALQCSLDNSISFTHDSALVIKTFLDSYFLSDSNNFKTIDDFNTKLHNSKKFKKKLNDENFEFDLVSILGSFSDNLDSILNN